MKRIAIIVDQISVGVYLNTLIEGLKASEHTQVHVLLALPFDYTDLRATGWFYRMIFSLESWIVGHFIKRVGALRERIAIEYTPFSAARKSSFDLIINTSAGRLKHGRLPECRNPLLDTRFGDLDRGLLGPPGFWESRYGTGASGMYLFDGGSCVFSARYKSKRTQTLNAENVLREGYHDLTQFLIRFGKTGILTAGERPSGGTWKSPGVLDVIAYRFRMVAREAAHFFKAYVLFRHQRFSVGIVNSHWEEAALSPALFVENPRAHYFADPFVIEREGRTICFVEDYSYRLDRGRIAALDLTDDEPVELGPVIEEPCHMSFPFVFEYQDDLFMIPETFEAEEISIYRCSDFPMGWERSGSLMDDVEASDTMVFEHEGRWWMLANLRPEGCLDFYSRLYAFYADSPLSKDWVPHPLNPVVIDSDGGRNGGLLKGRDGSLHRVGQHQGMMVYGTDYSVFRIDTLTPSDYHETRIVASVADPVAGQIGGHHVHSTSGKTAFDVLRWERV